MLERAIIILGMTAHFCGEKAIMPPMMFRMNGNIRNTDAAKECCHERMNDFNAPIFYE